VGISTENDKSQTLMPVCTVNRISLFSSNIHCVFSYKKNLLFNFFLKIKMGMEILYEYLVINILLSDCCIQVVTLLQCLPGAKFTCVECVILEVLP
jgi:hypothetical protein